MNASIEPSLTRGEYWLLNNVVDSTCPICFLVSDQIEELFNNPGHRLSPPRLVETLTSMVQRGWIEGYRCEDAAPLTAAEIEKGFLERPTEEGLELGYRLTETGGAIWEAFAAPNWDRYLHVWTSAEGEMNEWFCAIRWRLEKYLSLVHFMDVLVQPESIEWDEVVPWEATYWKTLPHGHRVRFLHMDVQAEFDGPKDLNRVPHTVMNLKRWYDWE